MPQFASPSTSSALARLTTNQAIGHRILDAFVESFDTLEAVAGIWEDAPNRWTVTIHFRDPPNETAVRALIALAAGPEAANALAFETTQTTDWVKASLDGLAPVEACRFVVHGAHDRARIGGNRIGIEIEAGLAFGTGHHGTTRGCLLALDRILRARRPRKILDIGTGTGVLAIAAAKALHRPVLASDIDGRAVVIARDNARRNGVGAQIAFVHAAGLGAQALRTRGPYDLVLANILLEPLERLATPISQVTAHNSRVVLSGLLTTQALPAMVAYRTRGFALEQRVALGGWTTVVLRRM